MIKKNLTLLICLIQYSSFAQPKGFENYTRLSSDSQIDSVSRMIIFTSIDGDSSDFYLYLNDLDIKGIYNCIQELKIILEINDIDILKPHEITSTFPENFDYFDSEKILTFEKDKKNRKKEFTITYFIEDVNIESPYFWLLIYSIDYESSVLSCTRLLKAE